MKMVRSVVGFRLYVSMLPGVYNMAVRILDFPYGSADILIEKQLNVATMEVVDNGTIPLGAHGLVALNGLCKQMENEGNDVH